MLARKTTLLLGLALLAVPRTGAADPLDLRPVDVRDQRITPGSAAAEDTAATETLDAQAAAQEGGSVADHLAQMPGVQVQRTGAHGDAASILIRGSSANQVGVFLDGLPLSFGRGGQPDLSIFPLLAFSRVELFRGMAPAELGSAALGGAINLVPAEAPRQPLTRIVLGAGSFGLARFGVARAARLGRVRYAVTGVLEAARNDFSFFSDNDTPYQLGDDRWLTRQNNDSFLGSAIAWVRIQLPDRIHLSLLESVQLKDKGVPGAGAVQAQQTHRRTVLQAFDAKLTAPRLGHPSLSGMVRANLWVTYQHFEDQAGELPSGTQDQRDLSLGAGVRGRLTWAPHATQLLGLLPEYRFDRYAGSDPGHALPTAKRHQAGVALRDRMSFWRDRVGITPVVRLDLLWHGVDGADSLGVPLQDQFSWFASPRLGLRVSPWRWLTLRGNVGRYFRPPAIFELYGDRGTTVGNPHLVPETGLSGDCGLVIRLRKRQLTRLHAHRWLRGLRLEATFFGRDTQDLIQWVRNSPHTTTALNIARAVAYGVETRLVAWLRLGFGLTSRASASYTFLHTENQSGQPLVDGNRLPGRPVHEVRGRLDLAWRRGRWGVGVHYGVTHDSESFLDEANLFLPVPTRTLHEVGLTLAPWIRGFQLTATVRNVADLRVEHQRAPASTGLGEIPRPLMDFAGFPLPGWQIWVTAAWKG